LLVLAFAAIAAVAVSAQGPPPPQVADPVLPGQVTGNTMDLPPTGNGDSDGNGDGEYPKPIKVKHYRKGARHTHNHREEPLPKPVLKQRKYPLVKPKTPGGPRTPRGLWRKPKNSTLKKKASGKKVKARIVNDVKPIRPRASRPVRAWLRDDVHAHEHHPQDHVHMHHHHHHHHVPTYDDVHITDDHHHVIPHHLHHKEDRHQVAPPLVIGNLHDEKHVGLAPLHEHITNAHDVHIHLGDHTTMRPDSAAATQRELKLINDVVNDHLRS